MVGWVGVNMTSLEFCCWSILYTISVIYFNTSCIKQTVKVLYVECFFRYIFMINCARCFQLEYVTLFTDLLAYRKKSQWGADRWGCQHVFDHWIDLKWHKVKQQMYNTCDIYYNTTFVWNTSPGYHLQQVHYHQHNSPLVFVHFISIPFFSLSRLEWSWETEICANVYRFSSCFSSMNKSWARFEVLIITNHHWWYVACKCTCL